MAARNSGSKMVGVAVTLTVAALGVGTVYLPFIADKDRLRGRHEEGEMTPAEQQDYDRAILEMQQRARMEPEKRSNSMWARMSGSDRK